MNSTEYRDLPVCPYCGHEDRDWWDGAPANAEAWEGSCGMCDGDYRVVMHVSRSFTTSPSEPHGFSGG